MSLFKKGGRATRVCRVETLNPGKGISTMMRVSKDQREYVVCLCLTNRTKKTTFHSEAGALDQMQKYRMLYEEKKG